MQKSFISIVCNSNKLAYYFYYLFKTSTKIRNAITTKNSVANIRRMKLSQGIRIYLDPRLKAALSSMQYGII